MPHWLRRRGQWHSGMATIMKKPKKAGHLVTTLVCDRMWGQRTCDWFTQVFPQYRGRTLLFDSSKAREIDPAVYLWLSANGKI